MVFLCNSAQQSSFILTDGKIKPLDVVTYNVLLFLTSHKEKLNKEINRTVANNKTNKILYIQKIQELIQVDLSSRNPQEYDTIIARNAKKRHCPLNVRM